MERILLFFASLVFASASHAVTLTYDISSPDDLSNIVVGDTVHFDVFLPGISAETWDTTAIFNARALSSDTTLWETPFNLNFNSALSVTSSVFEGHVGWVHVDTPLTMLSDFVMSFDIVAAAAGIGSFSVAGADVFEVFGEDSVFTGSGQVDFNIAAAAVPEPGALGLVGLGLLGLFALGRRSPA